MHSNFQQTAAILKFQLMIISFVELENEEKIVANPNNSRKGKGEKLVRHPSVLLFCCSGQHSYSTMTMMTNVLLLPFLLTLLLLPADALAVSGKVPSLTFYNNVQRS